MATRAAKKKVPVLEGVIVPIITPVDAQERVDERAFRAVLRRCLDAGVHAIFAGGSAGMGPLLSDREWCRAMEIAFDEVCGDVPLLGGVMATSTAGALDRIRTLDRIGFRFVVVTPTHYITLSQPAHFLAHFEACHDASDMEMVAYNIPPCTGSSIPVEVLLGLARRKKIRFCKESSGDRDYFETLLTKGRRAGLAMFEGCERDIAWGLERGAAGIVPVCANYDPHTFVQAWNAGRRGDTKARRQLQARIDTVRTTLAGDGSAWIGGVMYGCTKLGIGSGRPVAPLAEIPAEKRRRIDRLAAADRAAGRVAPVA